MRNFTTWVIVASALGWVFVMPAGAEEAKAAIHAISILNTLAKPAEARQAAFDQALREEPRAAAGSPSGEVMGDGTVRYGRATITVKNPCPPGEHYEPPPLPGRRRR